MISHQPYLGGRWSRPTYWKAIVMENVHVERSAGWSGLCFIVLAVVATFGAGTFPPAGASSAAVSAYIDAHRTGLLWGAWLTLPLSAFFLWFLVGLRSFLRRSSARPDGLPTLAMLAGLVVVSSAFTAAYLQSALAYGPTSAGADAAALYGVYVFVSGSLSYGPAAIFFLAAAWALARHYSAPAWLSWLGYLAALASTIATFGVFTTNPELAPPGGFLTLGGAVISLLWLLAMAIVLVRVKAPVPAP